MEWVLLLNQIKMGAQKKIRAVCSRTRTALMSTELRTLKLKSVWRACKLLTLIPIEFCIAENKDWCSGFVFFRHFDPQNLSDSKLTHLCTLAILNGALTMYNKLLANYQVHSSLCTGGCTIYAATVIFPPLSCQTNTYNNPMSLDAWNSSDGFCRTEWVTLATPVLF